MTAFQLVVPGADYLDSYAAALRTGWSPSNLRDISGEHLAAIAADPAVFLADINRSGGGTIRLADGRDVPRLPGTMRWMWDGEFCGVIGLRYQPGTAALPDYATGHIGYAVIPAKRRRGYATMALRQLLPLAQAAGLPSVDLTCDDDNRPSQKVIESNGGALVSRTPEPDRPGHDKLLYRITLTLERSTS